jgi:hypothetical protein
MQYKFYIYKQAVLSSSFNKYNFAHYSLFRQITQLSKWSIKIDQDSDFLSVKRKNFNGNISVDGDDFTALIALENTHIQYCVQIMKYCNNVWSEHWKGFFSYFDFKVDLDRCQLNFTPSIWDVYTPVYDQMDIERNILAADSDFQVKMTNVEYANESVSVSYISIGGTANATWTEYTGYPAGNVYFMVSSNNTYLGIDTNLGMTIYDVTQVYKRDLGYTNSDTIGPSPDAEWVLDPLLPVDPNGNYSPGVWKWVRSYHSLADVLPHTYTHVVNGANIYEEIIDATGDEVTLIGLKRLHYILDYFATFINLTYASNFFMDSPVCPMGGNSLNLTCLQQISNLRSTSDTAIKGMMTLKDLLIGLRDTFNVYWYIDFSTNPLGNWRFEHRKFFDQGLSYTAYAPVIELDLNLYPDNVRHLRRYEWSKPSLVRFEKWEFAYSYSADWTDAGVEYPQLSIAGNDTRTVNVAWGTDAVAMYDGKNDLAQQGWVLYNVEDIAGWHVVNTVGAISGINMPNGRFSTANLLRDLWTWGRLLSIGNVNGVATTFGSYEKLKKQVELSIPQCCQDIDYNGIFHTDLGNGLMESGELDERGNLKISLKYE